MLYVQAASNTIEAKMELALTVDMPLCSALALYGLLEKYPDSIVQRMDLDPITLFVTLPASCRLRDGKTLELAGFYRLYDRTRTWFWEPQR